MAPVGWDSGLFLVGVYIGILLGMVILFFLVKWLTDPKQGNSHG